jgi:hypothetical protein
MAHDEGLLDIINAFQDGTKVKANASRHHAFSCKRADEIVKQLNGEIADLL